MTKEEPKPSGDNQHPEQPANDTATRPSPATDDAFVREFLVACQDFQQKQGHSAWALIPRRHYFILGIISNLTQEGPGGARVSDIAKCLRASLPNISRMIGSLEKQGLVMRDVDPADRRSTLVTLTDEGQRAYSEISALLMEYSTLVVEGMGAERARELVDLMDDCSQQMDESLEVMRARHPEGVRDAACMRGPHPHPFAGPCTDDEGDCQ